MGKQNRREELLELILKLTDEELKEVMRRFAEEMQKAGDAAQ